MGMGEEGVEVRGVSEMLNKGSYIMSKETKISII